MAPAHTSARAPLAAMGLQKKLISNVFIVFTNPKSFQIHHVSQTDKNRHVSCAFFHQVVPQGPRLKHGVCGDSMMIWKHSSYANPQKSKRNHEDMIYINWLSESTDICSIPPTCLVLFVCEERLLFRLHNACVIVSSTSSSKRKCLKLRDLMPGPICSHCWRKSSVMTGCK